MEHIPNQFDLPPAAPADPAAPGATMSAPAADRLTGFDVRPGGAPATPPARAPFVPADLQAVMNVPVRVRAVLGRARMDLDRLLHLQAGEIVELDRRPGEPIDIFVNDRFVARGEVVMIDDTLGVTLTEIVRQEH